MQHVLQTGLSAGMSAVSGFHSNKPPKVDPSFDGLKAVLPESFVPTAETKVTLRGKNGNVEAPYMSIGAWSWGDEATWHWSPEELPHVKEGWEVFRKAGINWIDNAQAYGSGESERICKQLFQGLNREEFVIQTKWYVVPDNTTNLFHPSRAPAKMLKDSLERMGLDYVDIYLVHGHIHAGSIAQTAKGLAECVDSGMTKTVGVANYSEKDMIEMADELKKYGIPLATNQCEFSILRRHPEVHGLLQACKDRGIVFQSYSSLAQGRLTGKYNSHNEPPKTYRFSSYPMKDIEPTLAVLDEIAKKRSKSIAAVALNYNISKGVVPVVGMRSAAQARQNAQAFGWRLTREEIKQIDEVSFEGKSTVLWQQG
ncbi:hypothetical protein LTR04_005581 [Oleoguttula sp. CCFEE 6159]|nr:hypothetical protein LTR04_005581 [Oleoguttula sp. CCFEE 6159]